MTTNTVKGIGFEGVMGNLWPNVFDTRRMAKDWIEQEIGAPWKDIRKHWRVQMVSVEVRKTSLTPKPAMT